MENPGSMLEPLRATARVFLKRAHPEWDAAVLLQILDAYDATLDRLVAVLLPVDAGAQVVAGSHRFTLPELVQQAGELGASRDASPRWFTLAELNRPFIPPRAEPDEA